MSLLLIYNMCAIELYNFTVHIVKDVFYLAIIASGHSGIRNHLIASTRDCFTSSSSGREREVMSDEAANTILLIVSNMLVLYLELYNQHLIIEGSG